jgi:hypothetical protein
MTVERHNKPEAEVRHNKVRSRGSFAELSFSLTCSDLV